MNKVFIIGNLTRDPELRTTQTGVSVCSFTVAVNRRKTQNAEAGQPEADFYRVSAWRQLAETCKQYLAKGRKVAVVGSLSLSHFTDKDGVQRSGLEVQADEVEFLTPRNEGGDFKSTSTPSAQESGGGFVRLDEDELPF